MVSRTVCVCFFMLHFVMNAVVLTEPECRSQFHDPGSKALMASIVFDGVVQGRSAVRNGRYNATFLVKEVILGDLPLNHLSHTYDAVIATPFAQVPNKRACVGSVNINERLIVYLGPPDDLGSPPVYTISALPDVSTKLALSEIRETVCSNCQRPAKGKLTTSDLVVDAGDRIQLHCRGRGKPTPTLTWIKDGRVLHADGREIRIREKKKSSRLTIRRARQAYDGVYQCRTENVLGADIREVFVDVLGDLEPLPQRTTPTPPTSLHHDHTVSGPQTTLDRITVSRQVNVLNATASSLSTSSPPLLVPGATAAGHRGVTCAQQSYCLNGGRCYFLPDLGKKFCKCGQDFIGDRCQFKSVFEIIEELKSREAHQYDRTATITVIVFVVLVLIAVCIAGYIMAKKKREEFYRKKSSRLQKQREVTPPAPFPNQSAIASHCKKIRTHHVHTQTPPIGHMEALPAIQKRLEASQNAPLTTDPFAKVPSQPAETHRQNSDDLFPLMPQNGPTKTISTSAVIESSPPPAFENCVRNPPNPLSPLNDPSKRPMSPVSQHSVYDNQPMPEDLTNGNHGLTPLSINGPQSSLPLSSTDADLRDYAEPTHVLSYAPSTTSVSSSSASSSSTSGPDSVVDSDDDEGGDSSTERALFERLIANPRVVTPRSGSLCSENFEQVVQPVNRQNNVNPPPTSNGRANFYRGSKPGSITSLTSLNGSPWEGFTLPPSLNNESNDLDYPNNTSTLPASYKTHGSDMCDVIPTNKYMLMFDGKNDSDKLQKEGESLIEKLQRLNDDPESVV